MNKTEIFDLLINRIKVVLFDIKEDLPEIRPDTYFVNLGASSCDRAEIAAEVIESMKINARLEDVLTADTVGQMVEQIYNHKLETISL